jgi:hypothetical protein
MLHSCTNRAIRACEIRNWLNRQEQIESDWVAPVRLAIDDMNLVVEGLVDNRHVLKTNPSHGLTAAKSDEGVRLLNAQTTANREKAARDTLSDCLPADGLSLFSFKKSQNPPPGMAWGGAGVTPAPLCGLNCFDIQSDEKREGGSGELWCAHPHCLESLDSYANAELLAAHTHTRHADNESLSSASSARSSGPTASTCSKHHTKLVTKPHTKLVILPGNGCNGDVFLANWYGWLHRKVSVAGIVDEVVLRAMPDPHVTRESIWISFIKDQIGVDEYTVVIGHSSGAVCAM